jgi:hypothetical protein
VQVVLYEELLLSGKFILSARKYSYSPPLEGCPQGGVVVLWRETAGEKLHGVPLVTGHDPEITTSDENWVLGLTC